MEGNRVTHGQVVINDFSVDKLVERCIHIFLNETYMFIVHFSGAHKLGASILSKVHKSVSKFIFFKNDTFSLLDILKVHLFQNKPGYDTTFSNLH